MSNKLLQKRSDMLYQSLKNQLEMRVTLQPPLIIRILNNMPWRRKVTRSETEAIIADAFERIIKNKIALFNGINLSFTSLVHDDNVYEPVFNVYPKR